MPQTIRYRHSITLLLFALLAMVTNPVWHAAGHLLTDHAPPDIECENKVQLDVEELCPHCEAVNLLFASSSDSSVYQELIQQEQDSAPSTQVAIFDHVFSSRLRAPPFLIEPPHSQSN